MHRAAVLGILLLVVLPSAGAPRPAAKAAVGPPAQQFAVQLLGIAQQVNQGYVRPVPVPELLREALAALYEAARQPVPSDLGERVERFAARDELVLLIQETHARTAAAAAALGRDPLTVACRGLCRALDRYSMVLAPDEQRRNVAMDQNAQGIGVDLFDSSGDGPLIVKTVHPGGPAQRAGLRPGDRITHVQGEPVEKDAVRLGKTLMESGPPENAFRDLLPDAPARAVKVTYTRSGARPATVELERRHFHVETVLGTGRDDGHRWHYWADRKRGIAHVRIALLAQQGSADPSEYGTAAELAGVLDRLHDEGMRGLVLDLRWTPGGYLEDSVDVARLFLGAVPVATIKSRNEPDDERRGGGPSKLLDLPLAVLVNGETSGGAELVAAALQDHKRAVIVGQRTLGKASVQRLLPINPVVDDGLGRAAVQLRLTTGTFFRPSGKNLHRFPDSKANDDWGILPDVEFRVSPELNRQLKDWWLAQTLRPGPSRERLPLDDPSADAQRQAAVDAIAALLDKKRK